MAIPKIFVSSTCYDLKYIRENLRYFVKTLGYEPVLSEEGAVFYNPKENTHTACVAEVPNCQIFVLIIGGRFGEKYIDGDVSITNAEYREAARLKIPIFTLVEQSVYNEYYLYLKNKLNKAVDRNKITYPSVDSIKIFDIIDEVRTSPLNNAVVAFKDFSDIESYLRQQWAAMVFSFLTEQNEEARVSDTLSIMKSMNERIEVLSQQILESVGTRQAKITIELYEQMVSSESVRCAGYWHLRPTPASVLSSDSFADWINKMGVAIQIDPSGGYAISSGGSMTQAYVDKCENDYSELKQKLSGSLKSHKMSVEEYLKGEKK